MRSLALDISPLRRHREFRLLLAGHGVSFFGNMVTDVALAFQVYALTHSTVLVGLLGGVELVPLLVLGLAGGLFADARDRRSMVIGSEAAFAVIALVLLGNALLAHPSVALVFAATFIRAGLYGLQRPSLDAMMPRLVDVHELPAMAAINTVVGTGAMIGGPAVAGLLISAAGVPAALVLDFVSFGFSLVMLMRMRALPPPPGAGAPSLRRLGEGFRYAWGRQELIGTYAVDVVAMFFGMPTALFPAIAARLGGPAVLGLLYAAPAVGSLLVALTSGWVRGVRRHGMAVVFAAGAWGLAIVAFGLAASAPVALPMLALAGAGDSVSGIFRQAIWNQTIPDNLRGRLAGLELVSFTSGPALGSVESGLAAGLFGVPLAVVSGGALCVAGVAVVAALLPRFRAYRAEAPAVA